LLFIKQNDTTSLNWSNSTKLSLLNTHTTVARPFLRDYPGELVTEEIYFWTLWCKLQGKIVTEADTLTIWLGATPSGLLSDSSPSPPFLCQIPFLPQPSQFSLAWDMHQISRLAYPVAWLKLSLLKHNRKQQIILTKYSAEISTIREHTRAQQMMTTVAQRVLIIFYRRRPSVVDLMYTGFLTEFTTQGYLPFCRADSEVHQIQSRCLLW